MNIYKISKNRHHENRNNRLDKLSGLIQNIVSDFFVKEEIIDNDNQIMSIIISKVVVSADLRLAKIFVRWFNKVEFDKADFLNILEQRSSDLHKIFAKKLYVKYVPKVKFYYEDGFDLKQRIIEQLRNNDFSKEKLDEFLSYDG